MDATNRTLSESELLPAAIAMTVTDLMAAGFMIVIAVLLKGIAKEMKTFLCICGCFGTAIILYAWTNYVPELYESAEEERSVMLLHLTIIGVSAIATAYKIAVTLAVILKWRRVTKSSYRASLLNEDETREENQILESSTLPSSENIRINNPITSVELHTQGSVAAHGSVFWRQSRRQGTQPQEHERDLSSETNREIDELQQNVAYSTMIWGQCQATQQQEVCPESLHTNVAYISSTFLKQGDQDRPLQEIEEEHLYASIN